MLIDYASALRAGQGLVPDFRLQAMQDAQMAFQREQMDMQRNEMARRQEAERQAQEQSAAFQRDMASAMASGGSADAITGLMFRYPEQFERHKAAFDRLEKDQQQTELTQMGSIYSRLSSGDAEGAANILRQRVEADREAGQEDAADIALLKALESNDPRELAVAKTMIGTQVAALGGVDTFKAVYGGSDAESRTSFQKDYDFIASTYGQAAADQYAQAEYDPTVVGQPGAPIYRQSQISGAAPAPLTMRGGDPSGSQGLVATRQQEEESAAVAQRLGMPESGPIGSWIERTAGVTASSRKRATGVKGTYHADDNARDFPTPTRSGNIALGRRLKSVFGPQFDVIYAETDKTGRHDDHVHVEPGPTLGKQIRSRGRGPVRIASKQQYDRLPSGSEYIAPDGSRRRKP